MERAANNIPGVKEGAKNYLAAKQIPQLFQVICMLLCRRPYVGA